MIERLTHKPISGYTGMAHSVQAIGVIGYAV